MDSSEISTLKLLLAQQPVAALATLHDGEPAVSMVPFAMFADAAGFVIHVSRLATHTNDMLLNAAVALLVTGPVAETPLALPRVSIQGRARRCEPASSQYEQARAVYLAKLPDAEELFTFADFSLFVIEPVAARFVAGFGRARSLTAERLQTVLRDNAA